MHGRTVIVISVLAVMGGWMGCASQDSGEGEELARVGSTVFRESDLDARIQGLPFLARAQFEGTQGRRSLLERMVEEEAFFQAAEAAGFDKKSVVAEEVERVRRHAMLRAYYEEVILGEARPSAEEVEAYYRTNVEAFRTESRIRVAHVLTKTAAEAERVRGLAEMGRDFATLASSYSIDDQTKGNGGMIPGFLSRGKQVPLLGKVDGLVNAAMNLTEEGQISPVVETNLGYHVLRAAEIHPGGLVPLDEVRDQISDRQTEMGSKELYDLKFIELSERFGVKYSKKYEPPTVQQLFDEAQSAISSKERIKVYEQILQSYPDDTRAYEAQFMIGFTYSEELQNYERARRAFETVLSRYPDCELAESARWMIENLGQADVPMDGLQLPDGVVRRPGSD